MHAGTHGFRMLTQMSLRLSADCKILVCTVRERRQRLGSSPEEAAKRQPEDCFCIESESGFAEIILTHTFSAAAGTAFRGRPPEHRRLSSRA